MIFTGRIFADVNLHGEGEIIYKNKKAAMPLFLFLLLNALITKDTACTCRHPLYIEALVLLHELEMQQIAFGENINHPIAIPLRLIGEVVRLHEGDFLTPLENTCVETVEIVGIAPLADKLRRGFQIMDIHTKHLVVFGLHLKHLLEEDFVT